MSWTTHLAINLSAILAKMSVSDIGLTVINGKMAAMADFHFNFPW